MSQSGGDGTRQTAPGQIHCPGVPHSSTSEIAAQQLQKLACHSRLTSLCHNNLSIRLVWWDYTASDWKSQEGFAIFPINLLCLFPVPQRCTSFCTIGTISPQSAGLRTIKNQKRDNHHDIANRALVSRAMAFIPLIVSLFSGTLSEQEATRLSGAKMAADVVLGLGLHPFFLPDRSAGVLRRVAMCMARQTTQASFRKSRRITKPGA